MTMAILSPGPPDGVLPVQSRSEDRWSAPEKLGRFSFGMVAVIVASLGLHAVVLGTAVVSGRTASAPPEEIPVELVKDVPQQAPDLKPAISPDTAKTDAKNEQPSKMEDAKTEPAKTEPANPEAAKPEAAKTELPRTEPAKVEASKTETAKPEPAKPDLAKLDPPKPPQPAADETLKSLQSELEALKAEHAALEADRAAQAQGQAVPHAPVDPGLGPLPDSFQAVALPPTGAAAEEAVSYQQIVFSQLAKAKEIGQRPGLPGSAGVHFSIDEAGKLLEVEIVHKSGVASLDAEAVSIVRKAAPFPPPPQGAQRSFDANVNFVVESAR